LLLQAQLHEGPNLLNWQTTGIMFNSQKLNPVRIRYVEITGKFIVLTCI